MYTCCSDIKWENVLVDANGWIKLGDLGLAATHDLGQTHTQGAGTPTWLAPGPSACSA